MTTDLYRLETKVDALTGAVNRLVLFEERQAVQALAIAETARTLAVVEDKLTLRVDTLEDKLLALVSATDKKLDMWINRGVGVWALAGTLFAGYKTFMP